ncbi:MAG: HlyC/CorC family transporter [Victivallales bacterium]|nr:HlyC/CorC family transporter [Victivallales bacterium]
MFLLLVLLAFYAGSETALTSVNRVWLQERAKEGDRRAQDACGLLANANRFFGTVLVGNNLTHVSLTAIARLAMSAFLARHLVAGSLAPALAREDSSWAAWLASLVLTPVVLVFGEALPKALGRRFANRGTLAVAKPMRCSEKLLAPFVWALSSLAKFLSLTPKDEAPLAAHGSVTREDLKVMAEMLGEQHLVGEEAAEMLQTVLELDQRPIETVMVPLIEIQSLPDTASLLELRELTAQTGFTHLLIYHERVDRITGTACLKEILAQKPEECTEQEFLQQSVKPFVNHKLLFVPESQSVSTLLDELRRRTVPIAIVVDEYGGMTGMATAEDLVELITGNLGDERDEAASGFRRLSPTSFLCSGRMEIRDLEEQLGMDIPNQGFETAAGLVLKLAGKIPSPGEHYHYHQVSITVLEVRQHRISKLKFSLTPIK